jgi:hypothetical protein
MDKKTVIKERRKRQNKEIRQLVESAKQDCTEYFHENYKYCDAEAVDELGLDSDLIGSLIDDYVIQIIKSCNTFKEHLAVLQEKQEQNEQLDFTYIHDLAHKNLGVARNLRIKDSVEILTTLMHSEDLEELKVAITILESCAVKLKPKSAYSALNLLKIKSKIS